MKNNIMTQEQKELLLKDLCARLPYGVVIHFDEESNQDNEYLYGIRENGGKLLINDAFYIEEIKPYLLPLSSMTEEQFIELKDFAGLKYEGYTLELVEWDDTCDKTLEFWLEEVPSYCVVKVFDWLNKNHFDYRRLIPMRLAKDATGLNIY